MFYFENGLYNTITFLHGTLCLTYQSLTTLQLKYFHCSFYTLITRLGSEKTDYTINLIALWFINIHLFVLLGRGEHSWAVTLLQKRGKIKIIWCKCRMIAQSQNAEQICIFKKIYVCDWVAFSMSQFICITNKMIQKLSSPCFQALHVYFAEVGYCKCHNFWRLEKDLVQITV